MPTLVEYYMAIASAPFSGDRVTWERTPFSDPVVEALYQAGLERSDGRYSLDAVSDAEEIVAIVRAAIDQHVEPQP